MTEMGMYAQQVGAGQDEAPTAPLRPKRGPAQKVSLIKHLSPRSVLQVFLTVMSLGSAVVAFVFAVMFRDYLTIQLVANYKGQLKSQILPCLRSTLDVCSNDREDMDMCWDRCCPPGYVCERSPTVGLYCQDGNNVCGGGDQNKFTWCRDFADIPGLCKSAVCQNKKMVFNMTFFAFLFAGLGVVFDIIDCVIFFAAPDAVRFKAGVNLTSSTIKWIAFGVVLGSGTQTFISDLYDVMCFNKEGMAMVQQTGEYLVSFVVSEVISALLSLMLAPISAYYGGKLIGVPYVK